MESLGKKIIFIVLSLFNKRDYERFGIDIYRKNGFDVEIWNVMYLLHPSLKRKEIYVSEHMRDWTSYKTINKMSQFSQKVKVEKDFSLFFLFVAPCDFSGLRLYLFLDLYQTNYYYFNLNPFISTNSSKKQKIIERVGRCAAELFLKPRISFFSTAMSNYKLPSIRSKRVYIHTFDYDVYLMDKEKRRYQKKDFVVFIDEYIPFHPDNYIGSNSAFRGTADVYYRELCLFFSHVEEIFNTEVVIAAHPRANYSDKPDYFGGRKIVFGKTYELIRDSIFTISHVSTALNFSVLLNKPIVFVTCNTMPDKKAVKIYERFFGRQFINVSLPFHNIDLKLHMEIDRNCYAKFREMYIKRRGTAEKYFAQVVCDNLKDLKVRGKANKIIEMDAISRFILIIVCLYIIIQERFDLSIERKDVRYKSDLSYINRPI